MNGEGNVFPHQQSLWPSDPDVVVVVMTVFAVSVDLPKNSSLLLRNENFFGDLLGGCEEAIGSLSGLCWSGNGSLSFSLSFNLSLGSGIGLP